MQKIMPFLWFDGQAEEAMNFYVSVFKNSKVISASPMSCTFELEGLTFYALNGGPHFKFNPAVSMFVDCEDQKEVDDLWGKLTSGGGKESQCGWLEDKYGLSWQIIPKILGELMSDPDPARAQRAVQAMLGMQKIDIAALKKAAG